jgi:hypothetical protein
MFIKSIVDDVYNATKTAAIGQEDIINITRTENAIEDLYSLRAPVVYKLEDLMMSLTLLIILFFMILLWYGFAQFIIYLAYHKKPKSVKYYDEVEEDLSSA